MTATPLLVARGLSKRYAITTKAEQTLFRALLRGLGRAPRREIWALREISFEIHRGETLGIVGLNGAGKSTLLMLLAGIIEPTEGTIEGVEGLRRPFLGLSASGQAELSVEDNIRLCAAFLGLTRRQTDERLDRILDFGELHPYRHAQQHELSKGYQQRVYFSTALFADSDIILVDETLTVGDMPFQRRCQAAFDELRQSGRTILLVSHDMDVVQKLCDRALYLRAGRLQVIGDVREATQRFIDDCAGDARQRETIQ